MHPFCVADVILSWKTSKVIQTAPVKAQSRTVTVNSAVENVMSCLVMKKKKTEQTKETIASNDLYLKMWYWHWKKKQKKTQKKTKKQKHYVS